MVKTGIFSLGSSDFSEAFSELSSFEARRLICLLLQANILTE